MPRVGDHEQHPGHVHHFPGHHLAGHHHAIQGSLDRKEVGRRGLRVERLVSRFRQPEELDAGGDQFLGEVLHRLGVHRQPEVDHCLLRPQEPDLGLAKSCLRLADALLGDRRADGAEALAGLAPQPDLGDRLQELRLGLADLGGIHQGQHVAAPHRVADLFGDRPDRAGDAGREPGHARLVVGDLPVRLDSLDNRSTPDREHLDTDLLDGLLGSELDAAVVQLALAVVLGPWQERERPLRPLQVGRGDLGDLLQLSHFRVLERTVRDAVLGAPTVVLAPGEQVGVAFDAPRFRHPMLTAPIVLLPGLAADQGGEGGHGPAGVVPPEGQSTQGREQEPRAKSRESRARPRSALVSRLLALLSGGNGRRFKDVDASRILIHGDLPRVGSPIPLAIGSGRDAGPSMRYWRRKQQRDRPESGHSREDAAWSGPAGAWQGVSSERRSRE